ncbi:hypothetical protein L6452_30686 [Arctium lappa]|uniref:Uncharacterized protein n=1 Tax=Arctium lappa TaxID=4217 RepID=A0ACB8ZK11_ARCLA|nr:hypothetical protein L6452_30686 [Arctium lappa]
MIGSQFEAFKLDLNNFIAHISQRVQILEDRATLEAGLVGTLDQHFACPLIDSLESATRRLDTLFDNAKLVAKHLNIGHLMVNEEGVAEEFKKGDIAAGIEKVLGARLFLDNLGAVGVDSKDNVLSKRDIISLQESYIPVGRHPRLHCQQLATPPNLGGDGERTHPQGLTFSAVKST